MTAGRSEVGPKFDFTIRDVLWLTVDVRTRRELAIKWAWVMYDAVLLS